MSLRTQINDVADSVPFDNDSNGFTADDVQEAIEEVDAKITGKPRAIIIFGYNGNASNRWLELNHSIPSNTSPYVAPESCRVKAISIAAKVNTTCTVSLYLNGVVIQTLSLTSSQANSVKDLSDLVAINEELSIKVTSGSIQEPIVTISLEIQL